MANPSTPSGLKNSSDNQACGSATMLCDLQLAMQALDPARHQGAFKLQRAGRIGEQPAGSRRSRPPARAGGGLAAASVRNRASWHCPPDRGFPGFLRCGAQRVLILRGSGRLHGSMNAVLKPRFNRPLTAFCGTQGTKLDLWRWVLDSKPQHRLPAGRQFCPALSNGPAPPRP